MDPKLLTFLLILFASAHISMHTVGPEQHAHTCMLKAPAAKQVPPGFWKQPQRT